MTYRLVIRAEQIKGEKITLDTKQLHYLLRVVRLNNGDRFIALDGAGKSWLAEIEAKSAHIVEQIESDTELPISLSLITALPKGSGYEQVIRCCTELGVSNFLPVISDRTILRPNKNKVQRWQKIVIEAAEQSERQVVPKVSLPEKFSSILTQTIPEQGKYICVARGTVPTLWQSLHQQTCSELVIATGCEGGWTESEVEQAISSGFQAVSLGSRILRAITAPIMVSSIVTTVFE